MRRTQPGRMASRLGLSTAAACLGIIALAAPARPVDGPAMPLRLTVQADLKVTAGDTKQAVSATSDFDYRLTPTPAGVETAVDRLTLTTRVNGREASFTEMDRDALVIRQGNQTQRIRRDGASAEAKEILDSFSTPLAVSKLDAEGGEASRETKKVAGPLGEAGIVDSAWIFHPKFPKDRDAWDAPAVFPLGKGQQAKGTLHYAKRKPAGAGPVVVDVTGDLAVEGKMGAAEVKKGTYKVKGTQTYDPATGEWVAGNLDVAITMDAALPNGTPVTGGGTSTLTMSRRGPK